MIEGVTITDFPGTPTQKAIYWFTLWYEAHQGKPYEFTTYSALSIDSGLPESSLQRAFTKNPPPWLEFSEAKRHFKINHTHNVGERETRSRPSEA
jgi:hypothetical protein